MTVPEIEAKRVPGSQVLYWMHGLRVRTNAWWSSTSGDTEQLLYSTVDLASHLYRWAVRREMIPDSGLIDPHSTDVAIEAAYLADPLAMKDEARAFVMRLSDKRAEALAAKGGAS